MITLLISIFPTTCAFLRKKYDDRDYICG